MDYELEIARERAQQELDEVNDMLARLRHERAQQPDPAPEWTPPAPEAPKPVSRAVEPRQRSSAIDWDKTRTWVLALIDGRVGTKTNKMVTEAVVALGGEAGNLIKEQRERIDAQATRISALEARCLEAEQRAASTGPRLVVGGSDAAD